MSFLRLRSDEQLVELFRAGNEEAFQVIHDRYRMRLFAYTRQMLPSSRQDAEDALQDVFVKAYSGLRASDRELALRAWLYRVAHNRCIDLLRRPAPLQAYDTEASSPASDPIAAAEQREVLRRLIADVRRLPEQQRSALLMRELSGMSYQELAVALDLSVPAIKSLLVRARVSLAAAQEARDIACDVIRAEIVDCHDRGVRPTATARRHMHDCDACKVFRTEVRGVSRNFAALLPLFGVAGAVRTGVLAKLLGIGGGSGGVASGGVASGGAVAGGAAAAGTGAVAAGGLLSTGHLASLLAAAVLTAGGAVAIQPALSSPAHHAKSPRHLIAAAPRQDPLTAAAPASAAGGGSTNLASSSTAQSASTAGAQQASGQAATTAKTALGAGTIDRNVTKLRAGTLAAGSGMSLGGSDETSAAQQAPPVTTPTTTTATYYSSSGTSTTVGTTTGTSTTATTSSPTSTTSSEGTVTTATTATTSATTTTPATATTTTPAGSSSS